MKNTEAHELQAGTSLFTTGGVKVTFVEMSTAEEPARPGARAEVRTVQVAVVEFEDGHREKIPPRSLHKGRMIR